MEKFELTDFSGGQQERSSAADFKANEWGKLKGFVVEDSRTVRSQWAVTDVGTWTALGLSAADSIRAQSLASLSANSGSDYLFAWVFKPLDENGMEVLTWSLVYKKVSSKTAEPAQVNYQATGSTQRWTQDYQGYWSDRTLDTTTTDWQYVRKSDGSIVSYDDYLHTSAPRFICNLPYYDVSGTSTAALLASCTPANSTSTKSYLLYEGSGYSGSPIVVKEYTDHLPSGSADTDANGDGVLDNGGALVVTSNVMPKANVGIWWRGQLILGDVEYFANPKGVEDAHSEAYTLYVSAYNDWLAAKDAYTKSNTVVNKTTTLKQISGGVATVTLNSTTGLAIGDTVFVSLLGTSYDGYRVLTGVTTSPNTVTFATSGANQGSTADTDGTVNRIYPIQPPTVIATIQPNRNIDYITAYKTYILAWKAKFDENKATSSNNGFPTAPSTGSYSAAALKRYRNGIWFSQPGTVDKFHPFAFTADICPPDAQIVGFVPVEDGLMVITTSSTKDSVILLRGTSLGYIADDGAVINVRVETVSGAVGSKPIDSALAPQRSSYWPKNASAVYIGRDGSVNITNGSNVLRGDTFTANETIQFEQAAVSVVDLGVSGHVNITTSGSLPAYDQVYAFKDYIFLSRGFRWYAMKQLEDNSFAWSELVYPYPLSGSPTNVDKARRIGPRHMLDIGGNIYFIGWDSRVYRLHTAETANELSAIRGTIVANETSTKTTTTRSRSSSVATVVLNNVTGLASGDSIYVSNLGASYDGVRTISTVNSGASSITFACGSGTESPTADTDGTVIKMYTTTTYPELTVSTQTLQGDDYYAKSFWHRVGVRVKQVYNSTSGTLLRIVTRDAPANALSSNSNTVTLNTAITERGEITAPALGPCVEFSADAVFTGDVSLEGIAVYKHGKVPRRK